MIQQCGNGRRSRAFRQSLFPLQQQQDGIGDLFFFNRDNVVYIFLNQRKRPFAGSPHRNSVGNRRGRLKRYGLPWATAAFMEGSFAG